MTPCGHGPADIRGSRVVGALGAAAGLAAVGALVGGGYRVEPAALVPAVLLNLAVGWSFIGVGIMAWVRRPDSRAGLLMVAVGFAWLVRIVGAVDHPAGFVAGVVTKSLYLGIVTHLLVTYPTGRAAARWQRVVIALGYLLTAPPGVLYLVLTAAAGECWTCPVNTVVIARVPPAPGSVGTSAVQVVVLLATMVLTVLLGVLLARWLRSGGARRREIAPAVWGGVAVVATTIVAFVAALAGFSPDVQFALAWSTDVVLALWPVALLLGLLRSSLDRAAVGQLIVELGEGLPGPDRLRTMIAETLHDPSAELAFWLPERARFVDARGTPVTVDPPGSGRALTYLERDGARIAVLVHDDALTAQPDLVDAVVASAALAVENERLHAEVRARLAEVRASQQRIVAASDSARRQVERDLHDGAQQRLVSVALLLRLARSHLRTAPVTETAALIADAIAELTAASEELQDLARGMYPTALSAAGLPAALAALAERSAVPVRIVTVPQARLPMPVEQTCYFVVSELLTNAAKHAAATAVTVAVRTGDGAVVVEVHDDGVGGADPAGSGLVGLADRVAAVGGRFAVSSPPGAGTAARATLPLAPTPTPTGN